MAGPAELLSVLRRGEPQLDTGLNPVSTSTTTPTTSPVPLSALAGGGPQGEAGADFSLANRLAGFLPDFSAGTGVMGSPEANAAMGPEPLAPEPTTDDFAGFLPEMPVGVQPLQLPPDKAGLTDVGNDTVTQLKALLTAYDSTGEADPRKLADTYRQLLGEDESEEVELSAKERIGIALLSINNPALAMQYLGDKRSKASRAAERNRGKRSTALQLGIEAANRATSAERDKLTFKAKVIDAIADARRQPALDALDEEVKRSTISANAALAAQRTFEASGGVVSKPLTTSQRATMINRLVSSQGMTVEEAAAQVDAQEAAARGEAASTSAAPAPSGPAVFTDSAGVSWDAKGNPITESAAPAASAPAPASGFKYRGTVYPTKAGALAAARAVSQAEFDRVKAAIGG